MKRFLHYSLSLFVIIFTILISECNASAPVDKLQTDAATFKNTLDIYITQATNLHNDLVIVIKALDMLDKIAKDLSSLDKALTNVDKVLKVAKDIPQTAEQANTLSANLKKIHDPVTQASTKVNALNDKLSGLHSDLKTFDSNLQNMITKTKDFEIKLNKYVTDIVIAQTCITSLPAGSLKDDLQKRLDELSGMSDHRIVQANTFLQDIIKKVNDIDDYIKKNVNKAIEPLYRLEEDLEALLTNINDLFNPLQDLEALFDKSFSVKFPYPDWKKPWKMKHYTLNIGFNIILGGFDKIKKEIENILSKELYKAAEIFGIDKLIKDLQKQADDELKKITDKLHMNFNVSIPGLDKLDQELKDMENAYNDLKKKLEMDTKPFENILKDIENDMMELENIYKSCK